MTKPEASDSNSSNDPSQRTTTSSRPHRQHGISSSKYKGVVPQHNGHWGAQIYANQHRIWLGTFKTEVAAATTYDSAAIKLRPGNHHRNFPWTALTAYEPAFQAHHNTDQVLNMIKDGSYQTKFGEFLTSISQGQTNPHNMNNQSKKEGYFCQELFRKELTPSDVGKLNRLVIPKRYAIKFFPTNVNDGLGDMELTIYDKSMISWKFRYCYWKSSQSFVFTRGWNRFVKDKGLKAKDIVAFYMCELRGNDGNFANKFCMIDVVACIGNQSRIDEENVLLREEEANLTNDDNKKEEKGFRLFGVKIF